MSDLERQLKKIDPDRYVAALYAPPELRRRLAALYAFDNELDRVRRIASEPLIGEIRYQWWREALADLGAAPARGRHELLEPLAAAGLQRCAEGLHQLIDAHALMLSDVAEGDPPIGRLRERIAQRGAAVARIAVELAGGAALEETAEFARDAAAAYHLARELYADCGDAEKAPDAAAFDAIRADVEAALDRCRKEHRPPPVETAPALLHAALAPDYMRLAAKRLRGDAAAEIGTLRRRAVLMRAALFGKI